MENMNYIQALSLLKKLSLVKGLNSFDLKINIRKKIIALEQALKPASEEQAKLKLITQDYDIAIDNLHKIISKNKTKTIDIDGKSVKVWDIQDGLLPVVEDGETKLAETYKNDIDKFKEENKKFNDFIQKSKIELIIDKIPLSKISEEDKNISDENLELLSDIIDFDK